MSAILTSYAESGIHGWIVGTAVTSSIKEWTDLASLVAQRKLAISGILWCVPVLALSKLSEYAFDSTSARPWFNSKIISFQGFLAGTILPLSKAINALFIDVFVHSMIALTPMPITTITCRMRPQMGHAACPRGFPRP